MKIVDFHCDVLYKLLLDRNLDFQQAGQPGLDVTYDRLREGRSLLQVFAVYIPREMEAQGIDPILESIDLFYEKVASCAGMRLVLTREDVEACADNGQIGALLSLEGVGGLRGRLSMLRLLHRLGVRAAGLTWNDANWAADGAMEPRGGGLTEQGRSFVAECNRLGVMVDVSHLSERAFWDVAAQSTRPFLASHSNARAVCEHPRNLTDLQIRALLEAGGVIGVTYVPWFIGGGETVVIDDLLRHIEHICALGGERHLMLGSDFDGIGRHVAGLSHPGEVGALREALLKRYTETQTAGFMADNALAFLRDNLPSRESL